MKYLGLPRYLIIWNNKGGIFNSFILVIWLIIYYINFYIYLLYNKTAT